MHLDTLSTPVLSATSTSIVVHSTADSIFKVDEIRIEGLQRIKHAFVLEHLPISRGNTFSPKSASDVIHSLYETGEFSDVNVLTQGKIVIVRVLEAPLVTQVDVAGVHEFPSDDLLKSLKALGVSPGRTYNKELMHQVEMGLKREYWKKGFASTEVHTTVSPVDRFHVQLLLSVVEGPSQMVKQINFIGNTVFDSRTLLDQMQLSTPNWSSWYKKDDVFNEGKLAVDLQTLRSFYLNRGYVDFSIDSANASISPDKQDVYLTISLSEGKCYSVEDVKLQGNLLGREAELLKLLSIVPGDTYSDEKVQRTTQRIADKLREYGYALAEVKTKSESNRLNQTLRLTFEVEPRQRVLVRYVNIIGNRRTRDEIVRREIRQIEGAWYDQHAINLSKERLSRLGYFNNIDFAVNPVEGAKDQVDLQVKVSERETGSASVSAGYSSTDKLVLSASVSQENIFGSGTGLHLNLNTSAANRTLSVRQTDPYFTIDGIQRITEAYYTTTNPISDSKDSSSIVRMGASTKFGIPFSELDMVYFGLGLEQDRLSLGPSASKSYRDYVSKVGQVVNTMPLTVGWSRDTRDDAYVPGRGYYLQANAELGIVPGDTRYYKADIQAQYYHSFSRGFVLGLNFEAGYGSGIAGKPYPIFLNYFAGGIGSVRGYEPGSLGPRDPVKGQPTGGSRMVVGNIEMTFPLPKTGYDRDLRAFGFLDAGNVWDAGSGGSKGTNGLRYSYGLGLEWISPVGPLKISLGFPIAPNNDDRRQMFQFQIGTAFH